MPDSPLRIFAADDNDLLRMGLAIFIESHQDMLLVGDADTGEAAVRLCAEVKPDVVLIDLKITIDGITAIQQIKQGNPNVWIVLLTTEGDMERIQAALDAGADYYLPKTTQTEALASAIRAARRPP